MNAKIERVQKTGKNGQVYEVMCLYLQAKNGKFILVQEIFVNDALKSVLDFIQE